MTTTELYSGYAGEGGKPSSRVLQPPGGGSSNIFGGPEPTPQQEVRKEQEKPVEPAQQKATPTADAQEGYQKNKPKGKADAPFAMFAESGKISDPTQFDKCGTESQNDADFRCYSVTDYRNAVMQNAATRQRAHSQATGAFNPITHEETAKESSPYEDYEQRRPHPQQVAQQQQPIRMVRGQGNYNIGKVQYNPITGEEYPADYNNKQNAGVQQEQEPEAVQPPSNDNVDAKNQSSSASTEKHNTPTEKTKAAPSTFQKVRQPPGGVSAGLW